MKKRTIFWGFVLILAWTSWPAFGQKQADYWYFGENAGLSFSAGAPVSLNDGQISTLEGCASISDAAGNLLFYTDGSVVRNRNHAFMSNGTGLMGDPSSTQSGVIIPNPTDGNIFYIFTVDACQNGLANGIRYSVVDMSLDNGLGRVTVKNTLLQNMVAEKITAVRHGNNAALWVLTHGYGNNNYYAFLIDENGVNATPVISSVGSVHNGTNDPFDACGTFGSSRGYMKASPDGKTISLAIGRSQNIEICDFNNTNGLVTNPVTIGGFGDPYGMEYSPDGHLLYVTDLVAPSRIVQIDLRNGNALTQITSSTATSYSALQVASDGKIYVGKVGLNTLASIEQPNEVGTACDFQVTSVGLGTGICYYGLPCFIQSFFYDPNFSYEGQCLGEVTTFSLNDVANVDSVLWTFGDPASGVFNTDRTFNPIHNYNAVGNYTVRLTVYYPTAIEVLEDVIQIYDLNIDLGADRVACGSSQLSLPTGLASITWSTGQSTRIITVNASGTYSVNVVDGKGCQDSDEVVLTVVSSPIMDSTRVFRGCNGQANGAITLFASQGVPPLRYSLNNGPYVFANTFPNLSPGSYAARVQDANGCITLQNLTLTSPTALGLSTSTVDPLCFGLSVGSATVAPSGGVGPYQVLWSSGNIGTSRQNLPAGWHGLVLTDANGCQRRDSVLINQPPAIVATATRQDVLCFGESTGALNVQVTGGTGLLSLTWAHGPTTASITGLAAGEYVLKTTDVRMCFKQDTFVVNQPQFPLRIGQVLANDIRCFNGEDGSIELTVSGGSAPYSFSWSNGASTPIISNLERDSYEVIVRDVNGCQVDTFAEIFEPLAPIESQVSFDNVTCYDAADGSVDLTVEGGTAPYQFLWSNSLQTEDLAHMAGGQYIVQITDASGCEWADTATIFEPSDPLVLSLAAQNIACKGARTGRIDLGIAGGITDYQALWNTGDTSTTLTQLSAGFYSVRVTDANGCQRDTSVILLEPFFAFEVNRAALTHIPCNGFPQGGIDLGVVGGAPPYSYTWSNGTTTQDQVGLAAGNYTVLIADRNNCVIDTSFAILQPESPLTVNWDIEPVRCKGQANGAVELSITGGTGPYVVAWSDGSADLERTGLLSGNLQLTVTDATNCVWTNQLFVPEPAAPLGFTANSENVACKGENSGRIELSPRGGTTPYGIAWNHGPNTFTIQNLSAGTYSATITDSKGCQTVYTAPISQPDFKFSIANESLVDVQCFGASDGRISLEIVGGTQPYNFLWSNNETTEDLQDVGAGTYILLARDARECLLVDTFALDQPAAPLLLDLQGQNADCKDATNGAIDLSINGGTSPYQTLWSNGETSQDIDLLTPGLYTVAVTDAQGCLAEGQVRIQTSLVVSYVEKPVSCFGGSDGGVNVSVVGGTPNYQFAWDHGKASEDLSGLLPGTYNLLVTDAEGCQTLLEAVVTQPNFPLRLDIASRNVSCHEGRDGQIELSASGGTQPYRFVWSNNSTNQNLTGVPDGYYVVSVLDARNCLADTFATLSQPPAPLLGSTSHADVLCFGQASGSINLQVSGGTPNYSYRWSHNSYTQNQFNLRGGRYWVRVTDAKGCTWSDTIVLDEPLQALRLEQTIDSIACHGDPTGAIGLAASGGTPGYRYDWTDGSSSPNRSGLVAGSYSVVVKDAHDCTLNRSFALNQPLPLQANFDALDVACNGQRSGRLAAIPSGGVVPYSYTWSVNQTDSLLENLAAGTYQLLLSDAKGCTYQSSASVGQPALPLGANWQVSPVRCKGEATGAVELEILGGTPAYAVVWGDGESGASHGGLAWGWHAARIEDAKGCVYMDSVFLTEPAQTLSLQVDSVSVNCPGSANGALDLSVFGGDLPYEYLWNDGQDSQDLIGISGGYYWVRVTDSRGCQRQVDAFVQEPLPFQSSASVQNVSCFNGSDGALNLTVGGGTPGYRYQWSNNQNFEDISGLSAGEHIVVITDNRNCTHRDSFSVEEPLEPLSAEIQHEDLACSGQGQGSISASFAGGTAPYVANWLYPNGNMSAGANLFGLQAGQYRLNLVDARGCLLRDSLTIVEPQPLDLVRSVVDVKCHGGTDGAILSQAEGGLPAYSYLWSNGQTSNNLFNLLPGIYSVLISDANDCQAFDTVKVTEPFGMEFVMESSYGCHGANDGTIELEVTGGQSPYSFLWSNDMMTEDIAGLGPGLYRVRVTDASNCSQFDELEIVEPEALRLADSTVTPASCAIVRNGSFSLEVEGGNPPYRYNWSNFSIDGNMGVSLETGFYTVMVYDSKDCPLQVEAFVPYLFEDCVGLTNAFTPNGDGVNDLWLMDGLSLFPDSKVLIFNRFGIQVFEGGPNDSWDGIFDGRPLPMDNYFYILDLNYQDEAPIRGNVMLVR